MENGRSPRTHCEGPLGTISNRFPWPSGHVAEEQLARWEKQAKELREQDQYVVVAEHPVYGILELGCWMCGYDEFLLKCAADPDFVRSFFDKVLAIQLAVIEQYYAVLGPYIDLTTSGDDFGFQKGPFLSPSMFESLIAPYFSSKDQADKGAWALLLLASHVWFGRPTCWIRSSTAGWTFSTRYKLPPTGMDPQLLKRRFGERLVFWGAVDVQKFLPQATPDEIPAHVNELIDVLGKDGGYVMAPAHEILEDVPAENIAAWIEAIQSQ